MTSFASRSRDGSCAKPSRVSRRRRKVRKSDGQRGWRRLTRPRFDRAGRHQPLHPLAKPSRCGHGTVVFKKAEAMPTTSLGFALAFFVAAFAVTLVGLALRAY